MTLKEFESMPIGTHVRIKGRLAKKVSDSHLSYDPKYAWAYFEYLDTHRRVTKRNKQVKLSAQHDTGI